MWMENVTPKFKCILEFQKLSSVKKPENFDRNKEKTTDLLSNINLIQH